jgi:hypothetical protein
METISFPRNKKWVIFCDSRIHIHAHKDILIEMIKVQALDFLAIMTKDLATLKSRESLARELLADERFFKEGRAWNKYVAELL